MKLPLALALPAALLLLVPTLLLADAQGSDAPRVGGRGPDGTSPMEWRGATVLHLAGVCQAARCLGDNRTDEGTFFLPAAGSDGRVVATWRPAHPSLRELRVVVAGHEATGPSPLVIELAGLAAGEHAVRVEPIGIVAGVVDQTVDWTARFLVDEPPVQHDAAGRSAFTVGAACALGVCDPAMRREPGILHAPWRAVGELHATWDPRDGPMRVQVRGTGFAVEGVPPLAMRLDGLPAGDHPVDVTPLGRWVALEEGVVEWRAHLLPELRS